MIFAQSDIQSNLGIKSIVLWLSNEFLNHSAILSLPPLSLSHALCFHFHLRFLSYFFIHSFSLTFYSFNLSLTHLFTDSPAHSLNHSLSLAFSFTHWFFLSLSLIQSLPISPVHSLFLSFSKESRRFYLNCFRKFVEKYIHKHLQLGNCKLTETIKPKILNSTQQGRSILN